MNQKMEFGDFQTPRTLCNQVCDILTNLDIHPETIIEPTCGKGTFLKASIDAFPSCQHILGFEINPDYIKATKSIHQATITQADFFELEWNKILNKTPQPILVLGNPPWVTNTSISIFNGSNLPKKSNTVKHRGIDAITGESNFDISEWMIFHMLKHLSGKNATLGMLCKTSVARRVLKRAWHSAFEIKNSLIRPIDSDDFFNVSVDACLLICLLEKGSIHQSCSVYSHLESRKPTSRWVLKNNSMIHHFKGGQNFEKYCGQSPLKWRSGVKHDCVNVLELKTDGKQFKNGFGDVFPLEGDYVYPMLKSSDLAKSNGQHFRYMLVTQKTIGEDTEKIKTESPLTWLYLKKYENDLDRRASIVYQKQPKFSIFGLGDYAFAPWKIAISGFYKHLYFRWIGPISQKPVMLDDTCYFLPFHSKKDALSVLKMLQSEKAIGFFKTRIFWDAKRPITAKILKELDLSVLSEELNIPLPQPFERYDTA